MRNLSEAVKVTEAWETFIKQKYGHNHSNKETSDFRDYQHASKVQPTVENFYKENHEKQTLEHVLDKKKTYESLTHGEMSIWEALELMNTLVDESDPDTQMPQIMHALQSAEAARRDNQPRWMILTCLIHDLGKYLFFLGEPQWTVSLSLYFLVFIKQIQNRLWETPFPLVVNSRRKLFIPNTLRRTLTIPVKSIPLCMVSTLLTVAWIKCI